MYRTRIPATAVALALLLPGVAGAQSPGPSASVAPGPSEGELALAAVRATDPRFAALPTLTDVQQEVSRTFGFESLYAGSWIGVVQTFSAIDDFAPGLLPAWTDPGTGRVVEVMLVDGCAEDIDGLPATDPCAWRHSWIFHVAADGSVTTVAESGSPDAP